jgi:hypothetical protein
VQLNQSNHGQNPQNNPNQELEHEVIAAIDISDLPKAELAGHAWRQRGTELTCISCPFTHATYLPPDYQLHGIDERGIPMIRRIVVA